MSVENANFSPSKKVSTLVEGEAMRGCSWTRCRRISVERVKSVHTLEKREQLQEVVVCVCVSHERV